MNYLSKKLSLLIIVPEGTQHTLGAIILGKTLRCVGARVKLEFCVTADRVHEIGAGEQFDGVFISASAQDSAEKLSEIIFNVRYNWRKTKVILGGGILNAQINLDAVTGTDYQNQRLESRGCSMLLKVKVQIFDSTIATWVHLEMQIERRTFANDVTW